MHIYLRAITKGLLPIGLFDVANLSKLQLDLALASLGQPLQLPDYFNYQEQYYQELRYLPGFDVETFISNIGGFVGIFLGYSMMQFPELLGKS